MPVFSFRTIQSPATGVYKEKGSKFLAFAFPAETEAEVKEKIQMLKKQYFDARHHCYAWMLGPEKKLFRAFDDGEPNHSAGDPILGQIRAKNITNVLVVVVRYFGGVKLGVGGLVNAYKLAAEDALNSAVIIEKEVTETLHLNYDYASTPEIMRLIKEFDLTIEQQEFTEACNISLVMKLKDKENVLERINLLKAMGANIIIDTNHD